jgi:hypothetical protein
VKIERRATFATIDSKSEVLQLKIARGGDALACRRKRRPSLGHCGGGMWMTSGVRRAPIALWLARVRTPRAIDKPARLTERLSPRVRTRFFCASARGDITRRAGLA